MPVLEPDTTIQLPSVTVLRASAGSGKTWTLTERYVQFLLSRSIPKNELRNILAITFSNNASREMKESVLLWLKSLCLRVPGRIAEMCLITTGGEEQISRRASETLEELLRSWSDFQVRTIDSFMSTIFRSSAIELGFAPEVEILLDPAPLVQYAFDLFLREAAEGTPAAGTVDRAIASLIAQKGESDGFPWAPASALRVRLMEIETQLANLESDPVVEELEPLMKGLESRILAALEQVSRLVEASGLEPSRRSSLGALLDSARAGRFSDIVEKSMGTGPVKKPGRGDARGLEAHERITEAWEAAAGLVGEYAASVARAFYAPFLRLHAQLAETIERVKRNRGTIFLGDINRRLASFLSRDIVPDIYFRIGERICHYLVDEFQDTSTIQWRNLFPLVENSLAQGGSLFVVGDTKQAIYGFRQADYTIMKGLETENPFPSARHAVTEMDVNYRSRSSILELNRRVFREIAPELPDYREAVRRSGLDQWEQRARDGAGPGSVDVTILDRDDGNPPEREKLHALLDDLKSRGWQWGDIAVLAPRNQDVIRITTWLNEKGIPFLSFSSLDVRRRKIATEILALLTFLDSPRDDLSFATFLLGDIFRAALQDTPGSPGPQRLHRFLIEHADRRPLYKAFQEQFPGTWKTFFTGLFRSAGYLPLYELASEIYAAFDVWRRSPPEEATLAKLLEAIKDFEGTGSNSLRDFLRFSEDPGEGGSWDIDVPESAQSVRAMTIHKSKGLGFPVVIVLLYGEKSRGPGVTVVRENGEIRLVRLARNLARRDPELDALYEEEVTRSRVNKLNSLYVGLTRAREEMHVIGVRSPEDLWPFDVLPQSKEPARPAAPAGPGGPRGGRAVEPQPAALSHEAGPAGFAPARRRLTLAERGRGELAHAALSRIRTASADLEGDLRQAAAQAAADLRQEAPGPELAAAAARLIRREPLAGLFQDQPGRRIFTEWELCGSDGRLFRADRIVIDDGRVAVIDWKTGDDEDEAGRHEEQISRYAEILGQIFPGKTVEALLAHLDTGEIRRVT
ncbi:MAG TPA: UvrD-helicase domain-containing protein [Spirochaetia bacterium]|nr:UvrD-helicase domain-containing protein [Spirochaetia bacterium]